MGFDIRQANKIGHKRAKETIRKRNDLHIGSKSSRNTISQAMSNALDILFWIMDLDVKVAGNNG